MTTTRATTATLADSPKKLYYLAYGAALHPKLLSTRLGSAKPISSTPVIVPSAFLSFDVQGIPFTSPAFSNAIIQGVNDQNWTTDPTLSRLSIQEREQRKDYRQWIWERCCPGLEFDSDLPPRLEGVAFELNSSDFETLTSSDAEIGETSRSELAWSCIPIECYSFTLGDSSKRLERLNAFIPIAPSSLSIYPNLQPSTEYLRLILLSSFFQTLSQPFLGHLVLLRPYSTLNKRFAGFFINLLMIPNFLFVHLPLRALGFGAKQTVVSRVSDRFVNRLTKGAEKVLSIWFGSGWKNDDRRLREGYVEKVVEEKKEE